MRTTHTRRLSYALLIPVLFLGACAAFDSTPEETIMAGERISILDLQEELRPSTNKMALKNIVVPPMRINKDWQQNGGMPQHVMQNLSLGSADQITQIWKSSIGAGSSKNIPLMAQPVVTAAKVFTLDTKSNVRAFHNQTGELLWNSNIKPESEKESVISGGIAFAGDVLYVTSGYNEVLALNPNNGEIYWRTAISAGSRAAPTIHNGRVFITALNNNAIALDAKSGKVLWEYEGVGETTGLLGAASPAADDRVIIFAFSSGDLVALRAENGSSIWSDNLSNSLRLGGMSGLSDIRGLPIINGDMVLAVSFGGKMVSVNKRNGNRLWQREISSAETPWIAGNTIYVFDKNYKLMALNVSNGEILWVSKVKKYQKATTRKGLLTWSGPIMAGGRLLLIGKDGRIAEFDPKTGEQLTQWSIRKNINIAPIIANDTLYLLTEDGSLLAYR